MVSVLEELRGFGLRFFPRKTSLLFYSLLSASSFVTQTNRGFFPYLDPHHVDILLSLPRAKASFGFQLELPLHFFIVSQG